MQTQRLRAILERRGKPGLLFVACYLTGSKLEMGAQNQIIASVGSAIGDAFG